MEDRHSNLHRRVNLDPTGGKLDGDIRVNGHVKRQATFARVMGYEFQPALQNGHLSRTEDDDHKHRAASCNLQGNAAFQSPGWIVLSSGHPFL